MPTKSAKAGARRAVSVPSCRHFGGTTLRYALPVWMDDELRALSVARGVPVAELVRRALGRLITREQRAAPRGGRTLTRAQVIRNTKKFAVQKACQVAEYQLMRVYCFVARVVLYSSPQRNASRGDRHGEQR